MPLGVGVESEEKRAVPRRHLTPSSPSWPLWHAVDNAWASLKQGTQSFTTASALRLLLVRQGVDRFVGGLAVAA